MLELPATKREVIELETRLNQMEGWIKAIRTLLVGFAELTPMLASESQPLVLKMFQQAELNLQSTGKDAFAVRFVQKMIEDLNGAGIIAAHAPTTTQQ